MPLFSSPFHARYQHHWGRIAAYFAVFLFTLQACGPAIQTFAQGWNNDMSPSWTGVSPDQARSGKKVYDVDTHLIHIGFVSAPRFADTGRWITGIWVGQVPFYRPLTSYIFWWQWRAWGDYEQRYNLVAVLLHLVAVLALVRLAGELFRSYRLPYPLVGMLLVTAVFVDGMGILDSQGTITAETFKLWKNEPDSLALLFFSLCVTAYVKRERLQGNTRQRAVAPVFWYVLLCLTKEAGVFLPLLLPIIEAGALREPNARITALRRMTPMWMVLPIYFVVRTCALHDVIGYRYGSNDAWLFRLGGNVVSGFGDALFVGNAAVVIITVAVCLGILYFHWLNRRARVALQERGALQRVAFFMAGPLVLLLAAAAVLAWYQVPMSNSFDMVSTIVQLLMPDALRAGIGNAVFLLCVGRALRQRPGFGVLCYAWALMTLGLTLFSPSVLHRYYLMNAGFSVLIAGGALLWLAPLVESVTQRVQQSRQTGKWGKQA